MTLGQTPYVDIDPFEMAAYLKDGYRIAQPINCPDELWVWKFRIFLFWQLRKIVINVIFRCQLKFHKQSQQIFPSAWLCMKKLLWSNVFLSDWQGSQTVSSNSFFKSRLFAGENFFLGDTLHETGSCWLSAQLESDSYQHPASAREPESRWSNQPGITKQWKPLTISMTQTQQDLLSYAQLPENSL